MGREENEREREERLRRKRQGRERTRKDRQGVRGRSWQTERETESQYDFC